MRLRKLYEHPIFIQLVVFTVLIGIVPLILISGFVFYKMADMAREEVMDSHEQVILQYTDGVEEKLRQYQESVIQIANNTIILKTLQQEDSDAYTRGRRVSEEVVKSLLLERKTEINSCMVYSALAQNPIYGQRASMLKEAAREGWFQKKNATQDGLDNIDNELISLMKTMKANEIQIFFKLKLPASLQSLLSGLKISAVYSIMGAVIGEWLGAEKGLGIYMTRAISSFRTDALFASIFLIIVLSLAVFKATEYAEKKLIPWKNNKI